MTPMRSSVIAVSWFHQFRQFNTAYESAVQGATSHWRLRDAASGSNTASISVSDTCCGQIFRNSRSVLAAAQTYRVDFLKKGWDIDENRHCSPVLNLVLGH